MKDKVTVIGIAGGTGSGKTTVVKKLVEVLPPHYVAVVPLDSYYNDTSQMTEEERHQINFDHPSAFDWKLLHQQLARNSTPLEPRKWKLLRFKAFPAEQARARSSLITTRSMWICTCV